MDISNLTSIYACISETNAKAMEMGGAEVTVTPTHTDKGKCLVVFVNQQAVYSPTAHGYLDTYTNCAEEIERYMNAY